MVFQYFLYIYYQFASIYILQIIHKGDPYATYSTMCDTRNSHSYTSHK